MLPALLIAGLAASACAPKRVADGAPVTPRPEPARSSRGLFEPKRTSPRAESPPVDQAPRPARAPDVADAAGPTGTSPPSPGSTGDPGRRAAALAAAQAGKPYQWGAAGPDRFDCSGLSHYVYSQLGVQLPRVSGRQASAGIHVDRHELRPGDLVFFVLSGARIDHVGVYLGDDRFVHAPRRGNPVRTDRLDDPWWRRHYRGARRIFTTPR